MNFPIPDGGASAENQIHEVERDPGSGISRSREALGPSVATTTASAAIVVPPSIMTWLPLTATAGASR